MANSIVNGTISGTTLTVTAGTINNANCFIYGTGVSTGAILVSGSGSSWTINKTQATISPAQPFYLVDLPTSSPLTGVSITSTGTATSNSVYITGTGTPALSLLNTPTQTNFDLSSGDFTIECWFYKTVTSVSGEMILNKGGLPSSNYPEYSIQFTGTNVLAFQTGNSTGSVASQTYSFGTILLNQWNHIAIVRVGTNISLWLNGTFISTTAQTQAPVPRTPTAGDLFIGGQTGATSGSTGSLIGTYVSNLRIIKGTAIYTPGGSITVPTTALTNVSGTVFLACKAQTLIDSGPFTYSLTASGGTLPYVAALIPSFGGGSGGQCSCSSTILYVGQVVTVYGTCTGTGSLTGQYSGIQYVISATNGSTTFTLATVDKSSIGSVAGTTTGLLFEVVSNTASTDNAYRSRNTTVPSLLPQASTNYNAYFSGSSYITVPSNSNFGYSGNFTIEGWYYFTSAPSTGSDAFMVLDSAALAGFGFDIISSGIEFSRTNYSTLGTVSYSWSINTWYHIAVVRSGSTITTYINGTSVGSVSSSSTFNAGILSIGRNYGGDFQYFKGYITNFRIVNGTAIYTSSPFTVPTSPLTAVSGTALLTFKSSTLLDLSTYIATLTQSGSTSVTFFTSLPATSAFPATGPGFIKSNFKTVGLLTGPPVPVSNNNLINSTLFKSQLGRYNTYLKTTTILSNLTNAKLNSVAILSNNNLINISGYNTPAQKLNITLKQNLGASGGTTTAYQIWGYGS